MAARRAALSRFQRQMIYGLTGCLWATGLVWYVYQQISARDEFGPIVPPTQEIVLKLHGALAMGFLILLGTLLPLHVRPGWRENQHRWSGGVLIGSAAILVLTGWGLYYLGHEGWRHAASLLHIYLGLALPLVIGIHVSQVKRRLRGASDAGAND